MRGGHGPNQTQQAAPSSHNHRLRVRGQRPRDSQLNSPYSQVRANANSAICQMNSRGNSSNGNRVLYKITMHSRLTTCSGSTLA